ncbi:HAD-IA family hydrolase [Agaribacter marinus]|uniref:HAD-IA family hydrolase n=1 Tax=Virgibacillus salarius TaxID=447199 RepID=A0A941DU42_9BACI|nr:MULTISPECIES: HAD-IA family hydrolase [Bacillaceae]MBR7795164.1 HAD-IA family hydrolase [Virgibacillus salarius]NAZ07880.1 HAD-IA family hydrolase [Agaribacter marinus]
MNILWDFDGTLIDTYPRYTECFKEVLQDKADEHEIYQQLKISFGHAITYFRMTREQEEEVRRLIDHISPEEVNPFEGLEHVLQFADTNVIMTHKDRKNLLRVLNYHGLASYFTDVVTIDDGFPRKPDTSSYVYLHEKYLLDLAVGDREIDLIPAKKLGIKTCSFQNQYISADFYLTSYTDFFEVVK